MDNSMINNAINSRVFHESYGEGIVTALASDGFCRVFFSVGERTVPVKSLREITDRNAEVLAGCRGDTSRLTDARLGWLAHALPLMDNATALTSARIDLLPHQIVLTHRIATNSPRRYLIADEVGLGKTIETALILRELASRGELTRALMIVPAGLVNNWHRELNEVFSLNFEVFGSGGDVFDRKSNAFAKHDRLIASIDTLKRPARIKKLLEAPPWDLVVFDEAHHLSAYKTGIKIKKTDNFLLAEKIQHHCRDLLLLSATPHQGDHFRFWMLTQLLDPSLFRDASEMREHRYRLNQVMFRRTKVDACRPDGSTLFARRVVHTKECKMADAETRFYDALYIYLRDGFALAKKNGNKGQALGFVMSIFQKIAASSFAAVCRTLRRRLIALALHEGLLHDAKMDIDRRDLAYNEATELIRTEYGLNDSQSDKVKAEGIVADWKRKILHKNLHEDDALARLVFGDGVDSVDATVNASDDTTVDAPAFASIELALPEERSRIRELLAQLPSQTETKVITLLDALNELWEQNPDERIVVFATYLGSVEAINDAINERYPDKGVVVLKGGDHGSKLAAEKRFKKSDGPKVMICTAAGREGINLQHSRILFNFDLPWNPMELEQRIGRIHRYGQLSTAQVYNFVLSDTIEGKIFLLLEQKLTEIVNTLGKVNTQGKIAEDLRVQILGQLSELLQYNTLYAAALSDTELKRTDDEIESALKSATEAREKMADLFQDMSSFSLDDYQPFADLSEVVGRMLSFLQVGLGRNGQNVIEDGDSCYAITSVKPDQATRRFTTDRNRSLSEEALELLGLDYSPMVEMLDRYRKRPASEIGVSVHSPDGQSGILSLWYVTIQSKGGHVQSHLVPLAVNTAGQRYPAWENQNQIEQLFQSEPSSRRIENATALLKEYIEPMLQRELRHRGLIDDSHGYDASLVGWIEAVS